jgi:iron complex transport system permease protein
LKQLHSKRSLPGKTTILFVSLILILIAAFVLDLSTGSVSIPLGKIVGVLTGGRDVKESWYKIIMLFRLPKTLTATLAGAALALSGLQMQTLFRNPLAGPYILGIGSGASLGVALVILSTTAGGAAYFLEGLGLAGDIGVMVAATLGSSLVLLLILLVSRRIKNVITILILGLLFGYATNAVVSILIHFSIGDRVQTYISWTFGGFGNNTWSKLKVFIPVLLGFLLLTQLSRKPLNALLLGESYAKSMGMKVREARTWIIVTTAVLTGTVTAFCGPIAFLGVAIPHLCRSLFDTSDHKTLLPATALAGSIVALISDMISQMPGSATVLPLNAVTSLIGAPVIAWVILRRRNLRETISS